MTSLLEVGETYVEFVRVNMNEHEKEMKFNDPNDVDGDDYVAGYDRETPKQVLVNVTLRVADGSPTNAAGRFISLSTKGILLDSNDDPVLIHKETKKKHAALGKMLAAFYGGKNVNQAVDYPADGDGSVLGVLNILNDEEMVEGLVQRPPVSVAIGTWKNPEGVEYNTFQSWAPIA